MTAAVTYERTERGLRVLTDKHGHATRAEQGVKDLLVAIGEDPQREGLLETPSRVVKAFAEMTAGYADDPASILSRTFDVSCDEMVVVSGIEFTSLCEHHMLPFIGTVKIGYVPGKRVVGLSKLGRLTECFARRLQVQERMTQQIATAVQEHLKPRAVGVVVKAQHQCMACRGIRKRATMTTSALLGDLKTDAAMRNEFLSL